jgi:uncharacterized membrane protein
MTDSQNDSEDVLDTDAAEAAEELAEAEDDAELVAALTALEEAAADDELGPIDYLVVEFPAGESTFTGEAIAELAALVDAGTVRLLDVVIVYKDEDGEIDVLEADNLGDLGSIGVLEATLAEMLAEDDLADIAEEMEPGSAAGVIVWENTWAAPFAVAVRRNGGQLISSGRIPTQALIAAIGSDDDDDDE